MKLEKLREIASKRTKGRVKRIHQTVQWMNDCHLCTMAHGTDEDAKAIVMMINHIDALLDVVEAAKGIQSYLPSGDGFGAGKYSEHNMRAKDLHKALERLEAVE